MIKNFDRVLLLWYLRNFIGEEGLVNIVFFVNVKSIFMINCFYVF